MLFRHIINFCFIQNYETLQVLVVAMKNWKLQLPQNSQELYELHNSPEHELGERIPHCKQFR